MRQSRAPTPSGRPRARAGTVTNVREASLWLSYTYLFVRMLKNPLAYGVAWHELSADPRLEGRRKALITDAARQLERCAAPRPGLASTQAGIQTHSTQAPCARPRGRRPHAGRGRMRAAARDGAAAPRRAGAR